MLGRSTRDLGEELGTGYDREVVHVDDLVLV
jgi:glutamate 5-kinase